MMKDKTEIKRKAWRKEGWKEKREGGRKKEGGGGRKEGTKK